MEEGGRYLSEEFPDIPCTDVGKRAVIALLRQIQMPAKRKKDALYEWGQQCGIEITATDYWMVTGFPTRRY